MKRSEFQKIEKPLNKKKNNKNNYEINEILYYSKNFLSFSTNEAVAESFKGKSTEVSYRL